MVVRRGSQERQRQAEEKVAGAGMSAFVSGMGSSLGAGVKGVTNLGVRGAKGAVQLGTGAVKGGVHMGISTVKGTANLAHGAANLAVDGIQTAAQTAAWSVKNPHLAAQAAISEVKHAPSQLLALGALGANTMKGKFSIGKLKDAIKAEEKNKAAVALKSMLIYIIFMCFYVQVTMRGLSDSGAFYMTESVKGQFTTVEMTENYVPNFAKTWEDISTVEEWYTWMDSAFKHAAFSVNTNPIDPRNPQRYPKNARMHVPAGYTLMNNKIVGPIRLGQLRVTRNGTCPDVPKELSMGAAGAPHRYECFGAAGGAGMWTHAGEDAAPFASFANASNVAAPFPYDGVKAVTGEALPAGTVKKSRGMHGQSYTSHKTGYTYDTPSHWVLFDPRDGKDVNEAAIKSLTDSRYIDLQTRAVFVDFASYNAQLDKMVVGRLLAELPPGGGLVPYAEFHSVRVYGFHTDEDSTEQILYGVVALFYLFYAGEEFLKLREEGPRKFFKSAINIAMILNIALFVFQVYFRLLAQMDAPGIALVDGKDFLDFAPATHAIRLSNELGAINTFLNWFKMIAYLSYIPTFALLTDTLGVAAPEIFGFSFVFFIVFIGFAQAHAMVFSGRREGYRTLGNSMYMLLRSLLGDFDFEEVRLAEPTVGPLFFVLFICLAVFVILNMLIAIVSDSYSTCREMMALKKEVHIFEEMTLYIRDTVDALPIIGKYIKRSRLKMEALALQAQHMAEEAAKKAKEAGAAGLHVPKGLPGKPTMKRGASKRGGFFRNTKVTPTAGEEVDEDGDGLADRVKFDMSGDGKLDSDMAVINQTKLSVGAGVVKHTTGREIDVDGDGVAGHVALDHDGDGNLDVVMSINKEGIQKLAIGTANAKVITTAVSEDGTATKQLVTLDTTGAGHADTVLEVDADESAVDRLTAAQLAGGQELDVDDDGVADMLAVDTTGDGRLDTVVTLHDARQKIHEAAPSQALVGAPEPLRSEVMDGQSLEAVVQSVYNAIDAMAISTQDPKVLETLSDRLVAHVKVLADISAGK